MSDGICTEVKLRDINEIYALITNLQSASWYQTTFSTNRHINVESACDRQVYMAARQTTRNKSLYVAQCYGTFSVLGSRKQHCVQNAAWSFVMSVDHLSLWRSVVSGSKRICAHISHVLLWEFVLDLINEFVNQCVIVSIYM